MRSERLRLNDIKTVGLFILNNIPPANGEDINLEIKRKTVTADDSFVCNVVINLYKKSETSIKKRNFEIKYEVSASLTAIEENIKDIAGVRVICSFPEDIYELADSFLRQDDIVLIEKKDYIKNPKPSGYRSLHLIVQVPIFLQKNKKMVNVEVQFRTIAMDFWASLEHKLRYKKDIPADQAQQLQEELLACATQSAQLDNRMQEIRNQLVSRADKGNQS